MKAAIGVWLLLLVLSGYGFYYCYSDYHIGILGESEGRRAVREYMDQKGMSGNATSIILLLGVPAATWWFTRRAN